jgi:hypothetical protein
MLTDEQAVQIYAAARLALFEAALKLNPTSPDAITALLATAGRAAFSECRKLMVGDSCLNTSSF